MPNNDLISRAAAIAEIEDYIEEYSDVDPETGLHNPKWCAMVEAKDVLVKLPAAQTCGWISVNERLPEVGKVVLAFGTRSATTGMFQGVSARNDCWNWKGTIKHVSHWMPLPNPPKEG